MTISNLSRLAGAFLLLAATSLTQFRVRARSPRARFHRQPLRNEGS